MPREVIGTLDIGTATTRCIIAEATNSGELRLKGMCQRHSKGLRRGLIVDADACASTVQETFSSAARMAGVSLEYVHVALSPLYATLQTTRGVVTVQGDKHEVGEGDILAAIQAAKRISLPPDREIVDIIPRQYLVDGHGGLKVPSRMVGTTLELDATLVVGDVTSLSILRSAVEQAGCSVASFPLKPLALGGLVLTADERERGVLLVDIGTGVTEMSYFEGGTITAISVLPIGGHNITHDLAVGLKISPPTAEKIKAEVDWFSMPNDKSFDLQTFGHVESRRLQTQSILDVLEPRLQELVELIRQHGARMSGQDYPLARTVLTGGALGTKTLARLAGSYLSGAVRLEMAARGPFDDPGFNTTFAVAVYAASRLGPAQATPSGKVSRGVWARAKGIWKDLWE